MASISFNVTHPQLTKTVTITVADARLLEFADNLRNATYNTGVVLTRAQAVDRLLEDMARDLRALYKESKAAADRATLPAPGEIDV